MNDFVMEVSFLQRQNAYLSKEVSPSDNVIEESLLQSPNVYLPTDLSVSGSVMESNLQPWKTRACKEVIVSGRVREVIPQCVNASTPRVCSALGSVTEVTLVKL